MEKDSLPCMRFQKSLKRGYYGEKKNKLAETLGFPVV